MSSVVLEGVFVLPNFMNLLWLMLQNQYFYIWQAIIWGYTFKVFNWVDQNSNPNRDKMLGSSHLPRLWLAELRGTCVGGKVAGELSKWASAAQPSHAMEFDGLGRAGPTFKRALK